MDRKKNLGWKECHGQDEKGLEIARVAHTTTEQGHNSQSLLARDSRTQKVRRQLPAFAGTLQ
jgi:hypothetical protein